MAGAVRLPAESVCIVLLTGLGDVVHGLPVANALKRDDPARRITWVVEPMPAPLLRGHAALDDVVVYERARGLAGVRALHRRMRGRRFDLTLDLNVDFKSVWPTIFSGARHRLGFDRARSRDGVWLFCNRRLPPGPRRHTQDLFLEFLSALGLDERPVVWDIRLTEAERRAQARFFGRFDGRPVAVVVPASGKRSKDWLADRWARVVDALARDFGYRVVLAGGPGERERRVARAVVDAARAEPVWALGDDLRRLIWIMDGARLVLAPDTGPLHIARALDVPVIGLYGHTNPWRVGPYRKYEDLWVDRYTDPDEAPDAARAEPRSGRMERITVDDVLERVRRATERYVRGVARSP